MRINGNAYRVSVNPPGEDQQIVITQGETFEGMDVSQILVGLEDEICHIRLASHTHERHLSFQRSAVKVDWNSAPNLQSRTEWTLWLAEVVGHSQGMVAADLEPELRKFWPKDQLPHRDQAPVVGSPEQGYRPIPLQGRGQRQAAQEGPQLPPAFRDAVQGPGMPTVRPKNVTNVQDYMRNQAAAKWVSSAKKSVDNDAGGPEGFDSEIGESQATHDTVPIPVELAQVSKAENGARIIKIPGGLPKGMEDTELKGREIMVGGELLTVDSVELSEEAGQDVLILRVQ